MTRGNVAVDNAQFKSRMMREELPVCQLVELADGLSLPFDSRTVDGNPEVIDSQFLVCRLPAQEPRHWFATTPFRRTLFSLAGKDGTEHGEKEHIGG